MSWLDRLKPGAYSSPSGIRIPFSFETVSRETTKRTAEFPINGLNDDLIQDNGYGSRKYALTCYFSGAEHDRIATQFELALLEKGVGQLEHPLYGTFAVVPTGTITRRNDLVSGNNESVIDVTFSTTLASVYPSGQGYPRSEIEDSISDFSLAAALQFEASVDLPTKVSQANFRGIVSSLLGQVRNAFEQIQGVTKEARRQFADQAATINESLDVLLGEPLVLAQEVVGLVLAPSRMVEGLASRLGGYASMAKGLVSTYGAESSTPTTLPESLRAARNRVILADTVLMAAAAGAVQSTVVSPGPTGGTGPTTFRTRPEAIAAAEGILATLDDVVAWRDASLGALGLLDTGPTYGQLRESVMGAAGYLVESSFDLIPERRIVLERDRTILDLCGELYGSIETERLDFLVASNDLSKDQILTLRRGDTIRYYA